MRPSPRRGNFLALMAVGVLTFGLQAGAAQATTRTRSYGVVLALSKIASADKAKGLAIRPRQTASSITFSALPTPTGPSTCPTGYLWYAPANPASALCVPYEYLPGGTATSPNDDTTCPTGAHLTMGPALCVSDSAAEIVAPVAPSTAQTD
jgi:hypothetical protein